MSEERRSEKSPPAEGSLPVGGMAPGKCDEARVEYRRRPPDGRAGHEIHPRRPPPPLPVGTPEPDPEPWPPVDLGTGPDDDGD